MVFSRIVRSRVVSLPVLGTISIDKTVRCGCGEFCSSGNAHFTLCSVRMRTCARDSSASDCGLQCGGDRTPLPTANTRLLRTCVVLDVRTSLAACPGRPRARSHARAIALHFISLDVCTDKCIMHINYTAHCKLDYWRTTVKANVKCVSRMGPAHNKLSNWFERLAPHSNAVTGRMLATISAQCLAHVSHSIIVWYVYSMPGCSDPAQIQIPIQNILVTQVKPARSC